MDYKAVQSQIVSDIESIESNAGIISEIIRYMPPKAHFFEDLKLIRSALDSAIQKIDTVGPNDILSFSLAMRQLKIMSTDLLADCKRNMHSA